jgi:predicted amidophosphoribosyltransferase
VLIDDLSTSGATLDACAEELKKNGVSRVEGLVVAHG